MTQLHKRLSPWLFALLFLLTWSAAGCGPTIQREELGTVETKVPKLPGSEVPFPMPELESPADKVRQTSANGAGPVPQPTVEPDNGPKK